ncbi:B- and T-lymphocyte attenuator-like isoform X2 [Phyllobates terribilis]|uniref:B- and T-lymphocyte attenuator-like isoform X2 n=1 Tax=Phyllobates terribilis TaxID=111132 RepID=UPI003CCB258A
MDTRLHVMWMEFLGILALLPLTFTTINQNGSSCVPSLNIPPNTQSSITEEQALILRCPVRSCSKELPNVTWCRTEEGGCGAVTSGRGVFYEWEDNMYVLKLVAAHRNDTGHYRCSAEYGGWRITGNVIIVTVIGANARVIGDRSQSWITYFSIALRLWMTVVVYVWIYCFLHQLKGKIFAPVKKSCSV